MTESIQRHGVFTRTLLAAGLIGCLLVAGCHGQQNQGQTMDMEPKPAEGKTVSAEPAALPPGNADQAARANNKFGWAVWAQTAGRKPGNTFISPASLSQALAMTGAGADGVTADEIWTSLGFTSESNRLADEAALIRSINGAQNADVSLSTANALWAGVAERLKPGYVHQMEQLFGAKVQNLDFANSQAAAGTINGWVESKTNQKIKDLVPSSALNRNTRMVLTNAVYFKANWFQTFDKKSTAKAPFKLDSGQSVQVDMMRAKHNANYAEDEQFQMLELPYKNRRIVFRAFVTKPSANLAALDGARASALAESARSDEVQIHLPRFKMTWSAEMNEPLQAIGIKKAFDDADFSKMFQDNTQRTAITAVIHKTFVEVDEVGTEAAGATAVIISRTSMPIRETVFKADQPFIFQIVDRETGTVLFMGRVSDPR